MSAVLAPVVALAFLVALLAGGHWVRQTLRAKFGRRKRR